MPVSDSYREYVVDQLRSFGDAAARKMFGGIGLFRDGLMFGLIADDVFYLKVDDSNRGDYEREGMGPFRPWEKSIVMSYYQVPEEVLEDPETLKIWAKISFAIAQRKAAGKAKKGNRKKS
jgi:DNA transformation protein